MKALKYTTYEYCALAQCGVYFLTEEVRVHKATPCAGPLEGIYLTKNYAILLEERQSYAYDKAH